MKKSKIFVGVFAIANLLFLNFAKAQTGNFTHNCGNSTCTCSFSFSFTTTHSTSTSGDSGLKWTSPIECESTDGKDNGSYSACLSNGTGNECSDKGAETCNCGENCAPEKDEKKENG